MKVHYNWIAFLLFYLGLGQFQTFAYNDTNFRQSIEFRTLTAIPPAPENKYQPGLAGPFAGIVQGNLIVAGGANFPEKKPWQGGKKVYEDQIYIYQKLDEDQGTWIIDPDHRLPQKIGYGLSVPTENGLLCLGGENGHEKSSQVFLIQWDPENGQLDFEYLPDLPTPLAFFGGDVLANQLYVVGGVEKTESTNKVYVLDLDRKGSQDFQWKELPHIPGPSRAFTSVVAQSDGRRDALFVFGGRSIDKNGHTKVLNDVLKYIPTTNTWHPLGDRVLADTQLGLMASSGIALGDHHVLLVGGDTGELFSRLEELEKGIAAQSNSTDLSSELNSVHQEKLQILENHPGFSKDIWAFNTITETWVKMGEATQGLPVTTKALSWNNKLIIPSGEVAPGVRTSEVLQLEIRKNPVHFGWVNSLIIIMYLAGILGVGLYFSKRQKTTLDYFKGGGRVPWWAAGLSIFGTMLSAITFIAIPAKSYASDWTYFVLNMSIILVTPVISYVFIPFYNKLQITSAYEYLELRFNLITRLLGSLSFILFQLGRIGIVLYLPSIALSMVTGVDIQLCILGMGTLSVLYTVLGGIEAVIWTDVIQVVLLLLGALMSFILIISSLDGGMEEFIQVGQGDNKFHILNLELSFTEPTFWVVLLGGIGANLITQGTDQSIVQRYITSKDIKSSRKALYTNALLVFPSSLLFFGLGTAIYVFFKVHPAESNPSLSNVDAIFPWFIVSQFPPGVTGLLIAAIFAAAMSSLSSSINSGATAFSKDFYQRFNPDISDRKVLNVAKWTSLIIGVGGVLFGLWMTTSDVKSLWDEFQKILGLFTGGLGGVFLLGIFFSRANGTGAILGIFGSGLVQWLVSQFTSLNLLMYSLTGLIACIVIGYLGSLVFPTSKERSN